MSTFNLHNDTSSHPVEKKKSNDISNPIWNPPWNPINIRILQEENERKNLEIMKEARRNGVLSPIGAWSVYDGTPIIIYEVKVEVSR